MAGGVNSGIRAAELPVPLYFTHGQGSRLWDVDGNEFIDYQLGQGALLYGHAPIGMADAVSTQSRLGFHFASQSELEIKVAEQLRAMIPRAELVRLTCSATEAVMASFRLARALTGRRLILRFEGHYHGWSDEGLVGYGPSPEAWGPEHEPARLHPSAGIIREVPEQFVVARWNDAEHLRQVIDRHRGEWAAMVCEPCLCNTGCIEPDPGLLDTLRELCDREQAVFIADETITGFRFGSAGACGVYHASPDLIILGKALGGGVPLAAFVGQASVFEPLVTGKVIHAGTLNANPLCLAAGNWCLETVAQSSDALTRLHHMGQRLMRGLREIAEVHSIRLRPQGPGGVFHATLLRPGVNEGPVRSHRDYVQRHDARRWAHLRRCLLEHGVRSIERGIWFLSLAHTEDDVAETLRRASLAMAHHASTWQPAA